MSDPVTERVPQRGGRRDVPVLRLPVEPGAEQFEPAAALGELLPQVVADTVALWAREEDPEARDEVAAYVTVLCDVLRDPGADPFLRTPVLATPGRARRALELFRRTLIDRLSARDDLAGAIDLVELLRTLERLQARMDRDASERFASRLSGPDGLELVVQVAHDLRSPLTSILFLSETLHNARSGAINAVQERQLGLIYSAAFGLSQIANDLIEMARGGERLLDREPVAFSVADILLSVNDIVRPMAEEKGLEVRLQLPHGEDARLGHPVALTRALLNLTTNALKYTDQGHVEIGAIAISRSAMRLWVQDTGRGLTPDVLASLFDPFQRRYSRADYAFSSAGLGLSICRRLVSLMGGELQVESSPGEGTTFFFMLELDRAPGLAG
ncbi:MAG TPA: HAMP domain-containing sensor histidine kinase [Gemmatimonadaceae bacterium]|nr:HAMP domain-containing sensor histidine kinase [Gemmatimonadaceae bacterium]